jgi:hypothetical protein
VSTTTSKDEMIVMIIMHHEGKEDGACGPAGGGKGERPGTAAFRERERETRASVCGKKDRAAAACCPPILEGCQRGDDGDV